MTFRDRIRAWLGITQIVTAVTDVPSLTMFKAMEMKQAERHAKIDTLPGNSIVYLNQTFGSLTVKHVLYKHDVCDLSVVDNKIVSVLKPEFAELVHYPDCPSIQEESEEES